jgi:hypothetical protein
MIAIPLHVRASDELAWTAFPSWCAPAAITTPHGTSPVTSHRELSRLTAHQSTDEAPVIAGVAPPLTASTDAHAIQSP